MTRIESLPPSLQHSLKHHYCLKVIAGLGNFDARSVSRVANAAGIGGADLLDIACDPELVRIAKEASGLPICVSAVEPGLFRDSVEAGASMVEIGNFDIFYPQGRFFSAQEVLALAIETRQILPEIILSVTVPHVLPLDEQAELAIDLVGAGVDMIQTEGAASSKPMNPGVLGLIEKATPTLAASLTIKSRLKEDGLEVPIICASGLSEATVSMAFAAGANCVGVGSAINKLTDEISMIAAVRNLRESIISVPSSISPIL